MSTKAQRRVSQSSSEVAVRHLLAH